MHMTIAKALKAVREERGIGLMGCMTNKQAQGSPSISYLAKRKRWQMQSAAYELDYVISWK